MPARPTLLVPFMIALALVLAPAGSAAQATKPPESAGPYVPTPWVIVDEIMKLAQIGPDDFVVDLGSGDGRLVITAAKRYGARGGFGVDIEPALVALANDTAAKEGVDAKVHFHLRDLYATPVGEASVVTIYLLPTSASKVEPKLLAELAPGTRVVSHDYPFPRWPHERAVKMDVAEKVPISGTPRTTLYLYIVPARIAGDWDLTLPPGIAATSPSLAIEQTAAGAKAFMRVRSRRVAIETIGVKGSDMWIVLPPRASGGKPLVLRGRVDGDRIEGTVDGGGAWRAVRRAA